MHKLFQDQGRQGAVFHYELEHWGHGKFIVLLNLVWPPIADEIVYAYTTSQVEGFAEAAVPESSIVRLEPGDYEFCTKPTVIDLTSIKTRKSGEISSGAAFKFVDQLREDHLVRILEAVRTSTVVVRRQKKVILGEKYG
ncbi:MAG: hypothetical protein ACXW5U_03275 [Thermoanaerobaculia bacterium]